MRFFTESSKLSASELKATREGHCSHDHRKQFSIS